MTQQTKLPPLPEPVVINGKNYWLEHHVREYAQGVAVACSITAIEAVLESEEMKGLRKDAERLDWLDAQAHCADWVDDEPTKRVIRAETGGVSTGNTWREAIDAAMEKQK